MNGIRHTGTDEDFINLDEFHAVVAIVIIIMDHHAGWIGKIQQLPGQFDLDGVAAADEIRQGIDIGGGGIGVSVGQKPCFKGFCRSRLIVILKGGGSKQNHIDI